jgi:hypothetical protein
MCKINIAAYDKKYFAAREGTAIGVRHYVRYKLLTKQERMQGSFHSVLDEIYA